MLLKEIGFFPHDYWDKFEKFREYLYFREDKFYISFTNCAISDKNYEHALNVWKTLRMKIMRDYHDLHLKVDILLLTCGFET